MVMFKFWVSVRAYNMGRRYGLPMIDYWSYYSDKELQEMFAATGYAVLNAKRGLKTGAELLRAAGFGCSQIAAITHSDMRTVKAWCEVWDMRLHNA